VNGEAGKGLLIESGAVRVRRRIGTIICVIAVIAALLLLVPGSAVAQVVEVTPEFEIDRSTETTPWVIWFAIGAAVLGALVLLGVGFGYMRFAPKFFGREEASRLPPGARPAHLVRQAASVRWAPPQAAAPATAPAPAPAAKEESAQAASQATAPPAGEAAVQADAAGQAEAEAPEEAPPTEAAAEPPAAEAPAAEAPAAEPPAAEAPAAEVPAAEPPAAEAPAAEVPAAQAPAAEPPAAEAPAAQAPAAEPPAAEAPAAQAPAAEPPAAESAPAEAPAVAQAPPATQGSSALDGETFERVLKEQTDKGVDRRVAEGRARAAAVVAARRKAQG
jgi:hypothetical protein